MASTKRLLRVVGCGLLTFLAVCTLAHGEEGSFHNLTKQAIDQLDAADRARAAGDLDGVRVALDGIGSEVEQLTRHAATYREIANQELDRCSNRVEALDRRIGEIRTEHERVRTEIASLEQTLAAAEERQHQSQAHLAETRRKIGVAQAALQEKRRRLDELQQWWWVPGYGLFLSIRTLADHDIEEIRSLEDSLRDESVRMRQAGGAIESESRLRAQLIEQIHADDETSRQLDAMHGEAAATMRELRSMALFLTEAEAFWLKVSTVLDVTVQDVSSDLQLLASLIGKELTITEFDEEFQPGETTMRDALLRFAHAVDDGSSFLLDTPTDYCGGPPQEALETPLSQSCNIQSITRYYEIVDSVRCSFRYVNPPHCPPAARTVDLNPSAVDAGRQRGTWVRAAGENWVGSPGTSPCQIEKAVYYGDFEGPDQCEMVCQADTSCASWTYNVSNRFMPNSTAQCWGAAKDFTVNRGAWSGFVSGGVQ